MQVKRVKAGQDDKMILTAMVVNDRFLGRIVRLWNREGLFSQRYVNTVAEWCVQYYKQYEKAPRQDIESIFTAWAAKRKDDDNVAIIEKFLSHLSDSYDENDTTNVEYLSDKAAEYFNRVRVQRLKDRLEGHLDLNNIDDALKEVTEHRRIQMGVGTAVDVLSDESLIDDVFTEENKSIIEYPGALGQFFGKHLERDGLIAFLAPEKRGKTFWLLDVAWMGVSQRRKVAFFEAGDMSQRQLMRRLSTKITGRPMEPKRVRVPVKMKRFGPEDVRVKYRWRTYKNKLSPGVVKKSIAEFRRRKLRSKDEFFRLSCHPNSTLTVPMIEDTIVNWANDGWVADVIVIDYADILAPTRVDDDYRNSINDVWKRLRSLSQKFHCLVVTATQADAASYTAHTLSLGNFSEDKRKNAHVTGIVGINATPAEKVRQLSRLNWAALREGDQSRREVVVATCLDIGKPAVLSCF